MALAYDEHTGGLIPTVANFRPQKDDVLRIPCYSGATNMPSQAIHWLQNSEYQTANYVPVTGFIFRESSKFETSILCFIDRDIYMPTNAISRDAVSLYGLANVNYNQIIQPNSVQQNGCDYFEMRIKTFKKISVDSGEVKGLPFLVIHPLARKIYQENFLAINPKYDGMVAAVKAIINPFVKGNADKLYSIIVTAASNIGDKGSYLKILSFQPFKFD